MGFCDMLPRSTQATGIPGELGDGWSTTSWMGKVLILRSRGSMLTLPFTNRVIGKNAMLSFRHDIFACDALSATTRLAVSEYF